MMFKFFRRKKKEKAVSDSLNIMTNVINSTFNSQKLYDELKVKCHPDLFQKGEIKDKAEQLFQRLQENRYDCDAMLSMKKDVIDFYTQNKNL